LSTICLSLQLLLCLIGLALLLHLGWAILLLLLLLLLLLCLRHLYIAKLRRPWALLLLLLLLNGPQHVLCLHRQRPHLPGQPLHACGVGAGPCDHGLGPMWPLLE
jgi:hypothetical protein